MECLSVQVSLLQNAAEVTKSVPDMVTFKNHSEKEHCLRKTYVPDYLQV